VNNPAGVAGLPRLIWITDAAAHGADATLQTAEQLCVLATPGAVCVQLRDKVWSGRQRLELGHALRLITRRHGQSLSVNDRLDLTWMLDAEGLHLGESSVSASEARRFFAARGRPCWISQATHGVSAATGAAVDALVLAPIFSSKKGARSLGLPALAEQAALSERPVYALGGVLPSNCESALSAGATGVAAISAGYDSAAALLSALGARR
jgi:thiamine-phosphate pyrophosphorylase